MDEITAEKSRLRYLPATLLTLGNGIGGLLCILMAFNGLYREAVLWLFFGFFMDTFDGPAARYLNATSQFGAELDSMCDVITFGVAPCALVFSYSQGVLLSNIPVYFAFVYIICAVVRLARFGTIPSPPRRHLGLASPMAAIVVAATIGWAPPLPPTASIIFLSVITLASALMMVTERLYHKILAAASKKFRLIDWALWLSTGLLLVLWWLFDYPDFLVIIIWIVCAGYAVFLGAPFLKWDEEGAKLFFQK